MIIVILIVVLIIVIAKLLHAINHSDSNIVNVKKQKNQYEEELLKIVDQYIEEVLNALSNNTQLPDYIDQTKINWNDDYKYKNIVIKETLNHEVSHSIIYVNLHSINRLINDKNGFVDIDIMWQFSKRISDKKWRINSIDIKYPSMKSD